jgi:hypothetical protein
MVGVASRDGQLRIEAVFLGPALPIVDYPVLDYGITAGEWNAVAASNQRVALRLARGESDAGSSRTAEMTQRDDLDRTMAQLVR